METALKVFLSLLGFVVAGIPAYVWLIARHLLEPDGFWQELVTLGLGVWVLGGLQFMCIFMLIAWLVTVWSD